MNRERRHLIKVLKDNFGEPGTQTIIRYVNSTLKENNESMFDTHFARLATKDDIRNMATKDDIANMATKDDIRNMATKDDLERFATKDDLKSFPTKEDIKEQLTHFTTKEDFADFRSLIKGDLSKLELGMSNMRRELELKISDTKSDLVRWMFALFVTMLLAVLGLYFKK